MANKNEIIIEQDQEEGNATTNISVEVLSGEVVTREDDNEKDGMALAWGTYPLFREFIRKIPCVVCQTLFGRNGQDEEEFELDYVPELIHVSDPHHVQSRGAGGPDAENLAPLCRKHHDRWQEFGPLEFQARFNIDLKKIAIDLYDRFMNSETIEESADKVFACHQRILARISAIKDATARAAFEVCEFADKKWDGRPSYKWLGFTTFGAYATAPISQGGLGLRERTAYRMLAMARIKISIPDSLELVQNLGPYKSEIILPLIKRERDIDKKRAMCEAAAAMPLADVISWKNNLRGIKDKRETLRDKIYQTIEQFLSNKGFTDDDDFERLTWLILKAVSRTKEEDRPIKPRLKNIQLPQNAE
jgi:hypothetical protein